jgi:hypothetical protein
MSLKAANFFMEFAAFFIHTPFLCNPIIFTTPHI